MAKVKNISTGPRGAYLGGVLVMAEAGQAIEADDFAEEWFKPEGEDDGAKEPGPLDGSVPELITYLEGVTDADEVQKLIDAETGGKSRKGALEALEARRDALLAE
ncbi:hypothetical protein [Sphingobium fuliginis]|uniref:Uncharacterized protein n=1 Tax=Sphingobium fuliginis ATCC 27551 TaxID=1208342 RepID=A0A5B8CFQ8_SPHSA|nr:hypothetical protein [Sphingobium fuliginis]QDC37096.1 hypothetical protein FIL70_07540 [Sphingobium fuliginis ATCC 27551]